MALVPSGLACLIGIFLTGVALAPDAAPVAVLADEALLTGVFVAGVAGVLAGPFVADGVDTGTAFFVPIGVRVEAGVAPATCVLEVGTGGFLTGVEPDATGVDLVEAAGMAFFVPIGVLVGVAFAEAEEATGAFFTAEVDAVAGFLTGVALDVVVDLTGVAVGFFAACEAPWPTLEMLAMLAEK